MLPHARREMENGPLKWRAGFRVPRGVFTNGVVAQLVERLNGIEKVRSSTLLGSTMKWRVFGRMLPSVLLLENC